MSLHSFLPPHAAAFAAFQAAALFWLCLHVACTTLAGQLYKKIKFPWASAGPHLASARKSALSAVLVPLNMAVGYVLSLINFLLSAWQYIVLAGILVAATYTLSEYQTEAFVFLDTWWSALARTMLPAVRGAGNLLFAVIEIVVGIVNFLSQYSNTVLRNTAGQLAGAKGYSSSLYALFSGLAASLSNLVVAVTAWLRKLENLRHGVIFQPDYVSSTTSGLYSSDYSTEFYNLGVPGTVHPGNYQRVPPPELDLRSFVAPLRVVAYDLALRVRHACPAENDLLNIPIVGVFDPNTTLVDDVVHYAANLVLSVPETFLMSIILYFKTGLYFSPDVDYVFDTASSLVNAATAVGDAVLANAVNYVQKLVLGAPVWTPVPLFQIPGHIMLIQVDVMRLVFKAAANVPYFFDPGAGRAAAVSTPYDLFDCSHITNDIYELNEQAFGVVLAGVYPRYTVGIGNATRDLFNVPAGYLDFATQAARRLLIGTDPHNATRFADSYAAYPLCGLSESTTTGFGLANLWNGLYDVAEVFDLTVTQNIYTFAYSLESALRGYYPPVATTANLLIFAIANLQSTVFRQVAYVVYAVITQQPPSYACFQSLASVTRVTVDNFLDSIPDTWEFFLNIGLADELSSAHFNCEAYNVHNFMLTGSLKSYYFAGKVCNVHYSDGTLVSCDFAHKEDCPQYALPYADLNANLLCAFDVAILGGIKATVETLRIAVQYAQQQVIQLLACIIDTSTCNLAQAVSMQSLLAEASVVACFTYETTVKVSNVLSALLGFAYNVLYKVAANGGGPAYNQLTTSAPDLAAYVAGRHGRPEKYHLSPNDQACRGFTSGGAVRCLSNAYCEWDGVMCRENTGTHLAFQQFPLEAATTTFLVAILSPVFWVQYLLFMQANRFALVLDIDLASPVSPASQMIGAVAKLFTTDEYFVVLDSIRMTTLAVRDFIFGVVELIRAFLYVVNKCTSGPCPGEKGFAEFQTVLVDIVNLLESLVASVVGPVFQVVVQFGQIANDFAQIITGGDAGTLFGDIFNRIFIAPDSILITVIDLLPQMVLSIPGIVLELDRRRVSWTLPSCLKFLQSRVGAKQSDECNEHC